MTSTCPSPTLDVPGSRGLFEMYQKSDAKITLRDIAKTYLSGGDKKPLVGTPEQVADAMVYLLEEGGGDGIPDFAAVLCAGLLRGPCGLTRSRPAEKGPVPR